MPPPPPAPPAPPATALTRRPWFWIGTAATVVAVVLSVVLLVGWESDDRACEVERAVTFCVEWDDGVTVVDAGGLEPGSEAVIVSRAPDGEAVATVSDAGTLAGFTDRIGGPDAAYELRGVHRAGGPVTVAADLG